MQRAGMALLLVLTAWMAPAQVWSQPSKAPAAAPEEIVIRFSNFAYTPDHLHLRVGLPVRLQFVNESSGGHSFVAPAFFAASAFASGLLPPPGGKVEVAGRAAAELTLVPRMPGTYPVECTHFLHKLFGMTGTIVVVGPAG